MLVSKEEGAMVKAGKESGDVILSIEEAEEEELLGGAVTEEGVLLGATAAEVEEEVAEGIVNVR